MTGRGCDGCVRALGDHEAFLKGVREQRDDRRRVVVLQRVEDVGRQVRVGEQHGHDAVPSIHPNLAVVHRSLRGQGLCQLDHPADLQLAHVASLPEEGTAEGTASCTCCSLTLACNAHRVVYPNLTCQKVLECVEPLGADAMVASRMFHQVKIDGSGDCTATKRGDPRLVSRSK